MAKWVFMTLFLMETTIASYPQLMAWHPRRAIERTDWESMGGWAPPMMPPSPPKILLISKETPPAMDNQKEDKQDLLMPLLMMLGPIILCAILLPVFMSLLSGMMGFMKSMVAMKMPVMMMTPPTPPMMPGHQYNHHEIQNNFSPNSTRLNASETTKPTRSPCTISAEGANGMVQSSPTSMARRSISGIQHSFASHTLSSGAFSANSFIDASRGDHYRNYRNVQSSSTRTEFRKRQEHLLFER